MVRLTKSSHDTAIGHLDVLKTECRAWYIHTKNLSTIFAVLATSEYAFHALIPTKLQSDFVTFLRNQGLAG